VAHRLPVAHRHTHIAQNGVNAFFQGITVGHAVHLLDMKQDHAFADRRFIAFGPLVPVHLTEMAIAVARHPKHRVQHQPQVNARALQLAHDRVDQKRHVVVDDLDRRDIAQHTIGSDRLGIVDAHERSPDRRSAIRAKASRAIEASSVPSIGDQVFRRPFAEQRRGKLRKRLAPRPPRQAP
jgi:hypothetical protein